MQVVGDLKEMFGLLAEGVPAVKTPQLLEMVRRLGRSLDEVEKRELMSVIDDGDGWVEFIEFGLAFTHCGTGAQRIMRSSIRVLREAFSRFVMLVT
jgi:Ca2+-binding EF-hand superfamily protein